MPNSGVGQNGTLSYVSTVGADVFPVSRYGSHLMTDPLLPLILVVSDTAIPSQVQASDYMAVQLEAEETCCFDSTAAMRICR